MCRIAIVSERWREFELANIFDYLEQSNGGDGNGVWSAKTGEVTKGLKFSSKDAAAILAKHGGVFHTRLRSTGPVNQNALHPMPIADGAFMVQNGTWGSWTSYVDRSSKAITDTQAIAELVREHGRGVFLSTTLEHAGVFIWMKKGERIRVYKRRKRPFGLHLLEDGRWLYASEDVGELINAYSVYMPIAEETFFAIDEDGLPREINEERVTIPYRWSGSVYSSYRYDEDVCSTGVCGGSSYSLSKPSKGSYEDGESLAKSIEKSLPLEDSERIAIETSMLDWR